MRTTTDRMIQLRWLLLGAVGAAACGETTAASRTDGGAGRDATAGSGATGLGGTAAAGGELAASGKSNLAGSGGGVSNDGGKSGGGAASPESGAGGEGGSGHAAIPHGECQDPQLANAGFVTCSGGLVHRVEPGECENKLPTEPVTCGVEPNTYVCDGTKREACGSPGGGTPPATSCAIGCVVDSDCAVGEICLCGPQLGMCVAASCVVDADCEDGYFCRQIATEHGIGCGSVVSFQCQAPDDACASPADCGAAQRCQPALPGGPLRCEPEGSTACGRPFLIRGAPRVARATASTDWAAALELDVSALDAATRAALAEGWNGLGLLEHASVAAFARFTLQLLGLGAPCALVLASNQAICDEARHARLCFGLAASFGSTSAGPGELDSEGALARSSLADVVLDTFVEGCIGETVAAIEATEALASSTIPIVRDVLSQIAEDEASHAALAWRFVAWGTARAPGLRESLHGCWERELERAQLAAALLDRPSLLDAELAAGGLLPSSARAALRVRVLREVVGPCLAALPWPTGTERAPAHPSRG